ncbi:alpha/beta hydrolase [Ramlibacter albus]|uniref:Alpha/beta hydrolase n=1 Tax=Ramlibacter albus TaxID=2079448 RepID=A0A923MBY8_9BURK|nr:alpha/beta hydrolase [Ramlibacter albus]MBC5766247.1 alpha/beta hydrolase [Ramlibacter albus]
MHARRLAVLFLAALVSALAAAQAPAPAAREAPVRTLPVPDSVSPAMQKIIANPLHPRWLSEPKDANEWKALVKQAYDAVMPALPRLREALGVAVKPDTMGGVPVYVITPRSVAERNANRVLLHLHGGARVLHPGEAGTYEAILMAGLAGFHVVSVDYRMPPDHPFPAALDDAVAVYRALVAKYPPRNVAVFGASAGGSLTITTLLRARAEGLPMPGAIAPGTPTVDLTKTSDTLFTNDGVDNTLGTYDRMIRASALLYANGRDLKDPLLSPIYGDVRGFPPAILTSGTRDLYLSNTVRMHRKLRAAGVEAVLQVWEGQSHTQYIGDFNAPEVREYHEEVARFLDRHLGR